MGVLEDKVSDYLSRWADQLKAAKRSHFRVSAVLKAADIVKTLTLETLIKSNSLKSIKGIGPDIEKAILEIASTGRFSEIDSTPVSSREVKPIFYWWYSKKLASDEMYEDISGGGPFIVVTPAAHFERTGYMCDGGGTEEDEADVARTRSTLEPMGFHVDISGCEGNCCPYRGGDMAHMIAALNALPPDVAQKNASFGRFMESSGEE